LIEEVAGDLLDAGRLPADRYESMKLRLLGRLAGRLADDLLGGEHQGLPPRAEDRVEVHVDHPSCWLMRK
jgi:hypothetical protein